MSCIRNNTYQKIQTAFLGNEIEGRNTSFAHLISRSDAVRYMLQYKDEMLQDNSELYILDEVYGKIHKSNRDGSELVRLLTNSRFPNMNRSITRSLLSDLLFTDHKRNQHFNSEECGTWLYPIL